MKTPHELHQQMLEEHKQIKVERRERHRRNRISRSVIPITLV